MVAFEKLNILISFYNIYRPVVFEFEHVICSFVRCVCISDRQNIVGINFVVRCYDVVDKRVVMPVVEILDLRCEIVCLFLFIVAKAWRAWA